MDRASVDLFFAERFNWPMDVVDRQPYLRLRALKHAALALDELRESKAAADRIALEAQREARAPRR